MSEERRIRILRQMAKDGHTVHEIAERLGIGWSRVYEIAAENGVPLARKAKQAAA